MRLFFQNKHMWIIDSKITFKPLLPIITNTIHMHNLSLKSIDWSFENLNLKISSCFLATAHLNIYENSSNEIHSKIYEGLKITIDGSSLGYFRAENVSHIIIRKSSITGRNTESDSSFFVLQNSNMVIFNSTFTNNSIKFNATEPTFLNASGNSSIYFVDCIVSENIGYKNIIEVKNQNLISLINSSLSYNIIFNESFDPNERSIVRVNEGFVSIINCGFAHNQLDSAKNGGAVVYITSSFTINLESSTFTNNEGISLSAGAGQITIANCYIAENNSPQKITGTFIPYGTTIYILNSTFYKNYADDGGAVFSWSKSTIYFKNVHSRKIEPSQLVHLTLVEVEFTLKIVLL